jgi:hypothetical protein
VKPFHAKRQRGAALLALLAVIMLGASWLLVSKLNAASGMAQAAYRTRNAVVLNRAKQALIGYVAAQASKAGENRPGAFPCPEAAADFDDPANEGTISYPCTLPKVGRFPWKSLGLDKLVDASGEPLWYVVSAGWAAANTVINSNSVGQLTVDGVANDSVALIIAPGPAFYAPASTTTTGCTAWNQVRPTSGTPDWRNYLECENADSPADSTFVTFHSPNVDPVTKVITPVFNDQVVRITVADIMPALEAAIANRIEREILPALKTVYTPAAWGFLGANPVLPFAATFSPGPGAGTSSYQGASASYSGLLPFNQTQGCTESASDLRCTTVTTGTSATTGLPAFLVFSKPVSYVDTKVAGSGSVRTSSASATCVWASTVYTCTGEYNAPSISVSVSINVTNIAMGLRAFDSTKVTCTAVDNVGAGIPVQNVTCSSSVALQSNGSAILTVVTAALPDIASSGWGTFANYKINIDRAAFGDHTLLSTTDGTTGWFARNEWYRLLYYTVTASNSSSKVSSERTCGPPNNDCLSVTSSAGTSSASALLVLGGRAVNGRTRPSSTLADYFEFGNANGAFVRQTITPASASMYLDTGAANAYALAITSLAANSTLQFRALNSNTGTSTLTTTATGTRSLVNADGSNLSALTILANAAVQVTWDGTKFVLAKRPFNDRVITSASN